MVSRRSLGHAQLPLDPLSVGDCQIINVKQRIKMQTTRVTQTAMPAGLIPAGKLNPTYRGLLPVLALCFATTGWGQTGPGIRAPYRPPPNHSEVAAAVALPETGNARDHYKFISIDIKGSTYAVASSINDDGLVTGYYLDSNSVSHGFVWRDGDFRMVDYPGATSTSLGQVSNRGVAIAVYGDGVAQHTVTYSVESRTWTALPDIPGYSRNDGYGINEAGVAVGNAFSSTATVAWIWDPTTRSYYFFTVPGADANSTSPSGLNDKGQIAGYYSTEMGSVYHGFIKEYATFTTVDMPGTIDTYPDGINNNGVIQGQIFANTSYVAQGFIGTSGGAFEAVNYPGPWMTALVGISDRGDVCGAYSPIGVWTVATAFVAFRHEGRSFEP